jgi:uncharacterized protein (DUF427 family)
MQRDIPGAGPGIGLDYPRPPKLEATSKLIVVEFNGEVIARTRQALRLLETSHPSTYYFLPEDVRRELLLPSARRSVCEWKGQAAYWSVKVGDRVALDAAWSYPEPTRDQERIKDHIAFYAGRVDACYVDGEKVKPQPGGFYGGWISSDVVGPFKGGPGSAGW